MNDRLLGRFRETFRKGPYLHRDSSLGDRIAVCLYEDLLAMNKSKTYSARVELLEWVVNLRNARHGIKARRGDGTFGERVPTSAPFREEGFLVARGNIATIEIGAEVKVLAKAMIKQIDRVIGDLVKQVSQFRKGGGNPICVGIVGINYADHYTSFEGERAFRTDGKKYKHPKDEAADARRRIDELARPSFDEFLILPFRATNEEPYDFEWINRRAVEEDYAAILTRVSRTYESRFA